MMPHLHFRPGNLKAILRHTTDTLPTMKHAIYMQRYRRPILVHVTIHMALSTRGAALYILFRDI